MYKSSTYLIVIYFPTYLPIYMRSIPYQIGYQGETIYTNSVEVHPQLSNNRHLVDGVVMGIGSLWPAS
jgi:hypothetical protein